MVAIFFSCAIGVAQLESKSLVPVSWLKYFFLFAERKQVKRFAPPPVRLQIEKQLASQEWASNTAKVLITDI